MMERPEFLVATAPAPEASAARASGWLARVAGASWRLGFGLVLVCFALPFFTVSCQGQPLATVRGVHLLTGATIDPVTAQGQPVSDNQRLAVNQETWAIVAALAAVGGLLAGLSPTRLARPLALACAGLGVLALLLLREQAARLASGRASVGVSIAPEVGYWLALAGFLLVGLLALAPLAVVWSAWARAWLPSPLARLARGTSPLEPADREPAAGRGRA